MVNIQLKPVEQTYQIVLNVIQNNVAEFGAQQTYAVINSAIQKEALLWKYEQMAKDGLSLEGLPKTEKEAIWERTGLFTDYRQKRIELSKCFFVINNLNNDN